jgi:AAA domain
VSSTRYAEGGGPLRQERFASSFKHGLLANLVAKRCAEIDPPADRAAIWFAQWQSWQHLGFDLIARDILQKYPLTDWRRDANQWNYIMPCAYFKQMAKSIERLCLDPSGGLAEVWEALDDYRTKWIAGRPVYAETSVSRKVAVALDYTQSARVLTLIDGPARIGKSFAARSFCEESAGLARYVQVPCSNDDASFFRAIGQALGVSSSLQLKAAEMRARAEEVLQGGDLTLVLDEAHYLWPQQWQRYASPSRVNWIMTALVNCSVPVALITTPQFYAAQQRVERLTGWTSEQFIGRIGHVERLPAKLEKSDLLAVSRALLPEADTATLKALSAYAVLSKKHLASIEGIVKRSRWLAEQDGRKTVTSKDVCRAMKEGIIPSDTALAESLAPARTAGRNTFARLPRMRGGYAAAAPPSILAVECGGRKTLQRGSLLTT